MKYLFLAGTLVIMGLESYGQPWKSDKKVDGIEAFTRIKTKGLKEVKVIAEIDTSIEKLVKFISDYQNPKEWKHSTRKSKVVNRASEDLFTVYFVIATPWPLRDRDFYATVNVSQNLLGNYAEIILKPDLNFEKKGSKVRMKDFETKWILKEITPEKTSVELYSFGDPIGIPSSLVNMFIVDTPFKTVINLKNDIKTYQ